MLASEGEGEEIANIEEKGSKINVKENFSLRVSIGSRTGILKDRSGKRKSRLRLGAMLRKLKRGFLEV